MTDERRERYAAAMCRTSEWDWPTEDAYRVMADAAIAKADEEIHRERETMRAEWWRQREEIATVAKENALLRAELKRMAADALGVESQAAEHWATIERVRNEHARDDSNPHGPWCDTCMVSWPCRTARTLKGERRW